MNTVFSLKLVLVPLLIAAVTIAGRRWGPGIAGWLSGFPIVTGPILFFIAMEQGADFGAVAALGTLAGLPAVLIFNVTYAWMSIRHSWPASLACAALNYGCGVTALVSLQLSAMVLVPLVAALLLIAPRLFPAVPVTPASAARPGGHGELAYRMLAAALLVYAVTHFAAALGPRWSGAFAMFPIISIVMASFSHHYSGSAFAIRLLKGVILGWYALAVFCVLLYLLLPHMALWLALSVAAASALVVQTATRIFTGRALRT